MRVRMQSHIIGKPAYREGQIVELEPRIARAWAAENPPLCVILDDPQDIEPEPGAGGLER